MSTLYSATIWTNWRGVDPFRQDITDRIDLDQVPEIAIAAERSEVPLTAAFSDISFTAANPDGLFDRLFDSARIIGPLPPTEGAVIRAPAPHFGKLMFCRRASDLSMWKVEFVGFIDPVSVKFNRPAKTCTFTAYAVGKLLELGNAERINRLRFGGRPFLLAGYLTHPVASHNAADQTVKDNTWWRATTARGKIFPGDQFKAVHAVPWSEGVQTVTFADDTFTIVQVVEDGTQDVYFQTKEASALQLGPGPLPAAIMELLTPWWRSRKWEDLVADLIMEVNDELAQLEIADRLSVELTGLPLLPASDNLFAQPIDTADLVNPVSGVSYQKWNTGAPRLFISYSTEVAAKTDILGPIDTGPIGLALFIPPGTTKPQWGQDYGEFERVLSPSPILGAGAIDTDAGGGYDLALCGQDLHVFKAPEIANNQEFDSVKWTRTPDSYLSSGEPKRFYRIHARGRFIPPHGPQIDGTWRVGLTVQELTTSDSGGTWTVASTASNTVTRSLDDQAVAAPNEGQWSVRPELKVLRLQNGQHLYCWTDPYAAACYVKEASDEAQAANFMTTSLPDSFIPAGSVGCPIRSSGFVTEGPGSVTLWFFSDRTDGSGVDLWYWNGTAMAPATLVGFPSLTGCDFINAITDTSGSRHWLFVMQGKVLLALAYTWNPGAATLTCTRAHFVPLIQANYDPAKEAQAAATGASFDTVSAMAWLTGPVTQANPGEPDYPASAAACIVATTDNVQIVSNVAVNIVDVADFEGLSVAGALSDLILVRGYFMLTEPDQSLINDPDAYTPAGVVRFRQRLLQDPNPLDLVNATESIDAGTWLETFSSVIVQNSKAKLEPIGSDQTLKGLDGVTFSLLARPRDAGSTSLVLDNPFVATPSFQKVLANLYAVEFVAPRRDATLILKDPYTLGMSKVLRPGDWIRYLLQPPDELLGELEAVGRVLTLNYSLEHGLMTAKIA